MLSYDHEITYFNSILDDLGERVDRSEGRLKTAMRRVTDILRKEEGNLLFLVCIVLLI
jgi:syntaxin 6